MDPEDLDSWRIFFRNAGHDIFVIINKAITVAAKDYSLHLKLRRDQIVCQLYQLSFPCNQLEFCMPVEETNIYQPNSVSQSTFFRNCCNEGHEDQNNRADHVDTNLSAEEDKFFIIQHNDEKKIAKSTNEVEGGSNKETAEVGVEDRNPKVQYHNQILLLMPAKNTAIQQSGDSKKLGSDGGLNRNISNCLESSNKDDTLQDGLNKTFVDQSGGSKKLSFEGMLAEKHGDPRKGLNKNSSERSNCFKDGGPNLKQMGGSPFEQDGVWKNLIVEGDETIEEVFKIKKILEHFHNQSDLVLLELLRRLKRLNMSVEILKATLIGKTVNALRKCGTQKIRKVANSLISAWRKKVDEWLEANAAAENKNFLSLNSSSEDVHHRHEGVHLSAVEQLPSQPLNEGDAIAPSVADLLKIFEGVDEKEFFSLLPPDYTTDEFNFSDKLEFPEENELSVDKSPGRISMSERAREEERNPLYLWGTSSFQENKQPRTEKNELERYDKIKRLMDKDSTLKISPKRDRYKESRVQNNASEDALTKRRVSSSWEVHNKQGKHREENLVMKHSVTSQSRCKPEEPPKDKIIDNFEHRMEKSGYSRQLLSKQKDKVKVARSHELNKIEETRSRSSQGYRKAHDERKLHAIWDLDVDHRELNQEHKRRKH